MVGGEVVCSCGGCRHLVPGLLARLFSRCGDQPELSHGDTCAAKRMLKGELLSDTAAAETGTFLHTEYIKRRDSFSKSLDFSALTIPYVKETPRQLAKTVKSQKDAFTALVDSIPC